MAHRARNRSGQQGRDPPGPVRTTHGRVMLIKSVITVSSLFAGPPPAHVPARDPMLDDSNMAARDERAADDPAGLAHGAGIAGESGTTIAADDIRSLGITNPLASRGSPPLVHRLYTVPGVQVVPIELVCCIIDCLRGYSRTLCSCALTHSSWHRHAIKTLYSVICITNGSQLDAFRQSLLCRAVVARTAFAHTEEFILHPHHAEELSAHEVFATFVGTAFPKLRTLRIDSTDRYLGNAMTNPRFIIISPRRPLRNVAWSLRPPWCVPYYISKTFASVTTLSIKNQTFPDFCNFVRVVCSFPQLRSLALWGLTYARPNHLMGYEFPITPATGGRLQLQQLAIDRSIQSLLPFFSWFIKTRAVEGRTLCSLNCRSLVPLRSYRDRHHTKTLRQTSNSLHRVFVQLLSHLGSSLTHLTIPVVDDGEHSIQ